MDRKEKVIEIIRELTSQGEINDDSKLVEDLSIDSLNMVLLLINIETAFSFALKEDDMNPYKLITVNDVINLVERYCV